MSNHKQVHRAVSGLQHQCTQNGQHKKHQLLQDAALRKISFITFHGRFSFHT